MIKRIDRIATTLPPPSDPDPEGAAAVQGLMGGRFGEMSTFMNYTFQSFNFRDRQGARPFYDLIANIAGEEFGHIELVAATINTMLTGALPTSNGAGSEDVARPGQGRGQPAPLPRRRPGRPAAELAGGGRGTETASSSSATSSMTSHPQLLPGDGARNKLKVYEMVDHPAGVR